MMTQRSRLACALLLSFSAVALVLAGVDALSSGITEERAKDGGAVTTLVQGGCSCHNVAPGTSSATLEGVPPFYVPVGAETYEKKTYDLTITIVGGPEMSAEPGSNKGGFNLQVSAGKLLPPEDPGQAAHVQVIDDTEATHTAAGDRDANRVFRLRWDAPAEAGPDVQFVLTVNSVNGIAGNDAGDEWNRLTVLSMGASRLGAGPGEAEGVGAFTKLGVNFLAYWVGVVSFIVLFAVLGVTFFVLRYGETGHWTDWKDRAGKDKAPEPAAGESASDWTTPVVGTLALAAAGFATWQLWGQSVVAAGNLTAFTLLIFVSVATLAGGMVIAVYYAVARIRSRKAA